MLQYQTQQSSHLPAKLIIKWLADCYKKQFAGHNLANRIYGTRSKLSRTQWRALGDVICIMGDVICIILAACTCPDKFVVAILYGWMNKVATRVKRGTLPLLGVDVHVNGLLLVTVHDHSLPTVKSMLHKDVLIVPSIVVKVVFIYKLASSLADWCG